jgi:hypothetical protein
MMARQQFQSVRPAEGLLPSGGLQSLWLSATVGGAGDDQGAMVVLAGTLGQLPFWLQSAS